MKNIKGTRKQKELAFALKRGAKLSPDQLTGLISLGWALQNGKLTEAGLKIAKQGEDAIEAARRRPSAASETE